MSKQKMVMVPQTDLDKVEESRIALYAWLEEKYDNDPGLVQIMRLTSITSPLWKVANTKYEEVKNNL